jgi:hypothetical protein
MAAQIRRDLYADVTGLARSNGQRSPHDKRPVEAMRRLDWPNPNQLRLKWLRLPAAYHTPLCV